MGRILLVDDEPEIVILTKKILEKQGHQVSVAGDGVECLEILNEETPDLILLDIMMPGEDGWAICRKIKSYKKTSKIPVVMFTVRTSNDSVEKSFQYANADGQIGKPFQVDELLNVVNKFLA
jgi:CheY-like chemotaxis protein